MVFPEPKNVIFVEILLRPNFSPRSSGLPYFYRVKLDVIGFGQKAHFWNRETSYIKVLYMISHELDDILLKLFKMTRGMDGQTDMRRKRDDFLGLSHKDPLLLLRRR